jgi:hypothetical protein
MTTKDKEKPNAKNRQRSQKGSQRSQKPEPRQSPKLDVRNEDQIGQMGASTDAPTNGVAGPANEPLVGATAPADGPSIGTATPVDAPSIVAAAPAEAPSIVAAAPADDCPVSIQTIANAYVDYTRKSLQESRSFAGKLMGVRSFDNAIEVQTEFTRQALANFVDESQKICELYGKLATQIFRPWEGVAAKVTKAGR